jgi:hypothetical protein
VVVVAGVDVAVGDALAEAPTTTAGALLVGVAAPLVKLELGVAADAAATACAAGWVDSRPAT